MKNEKKVGTPILGSRELKLFEPVVVEFMLQELGFHVAHIQSCFYHIYVWASARIKNFHLGSAGGSVSADEYVFLCEGVKSVFYIGCPFPGHPVFQ